MHFSTWFRVLLSLSVTSVAIAGCLDFVDLEALPKCYKGAFLCIGDEDDSCKRGENQLQLHIAASGWDRRKQLGQVNFKFENEGDAKSKIDTIWVEDEYKLLNGFFSLTPVVNSPGVKYQVVNNKTVFADALAHHLLFDQHFVASCTLDSHKAMRNLRGLQEQGGPKGDRGSLKCVQNSDGVASHDSVSLLFDSRCTMADVETALSVGLIRVGVQMSDFKSRPRTKSFVSCQDVIEVEHFDPLEMSGMESWDYDEDEFWEDSDEETM